MSELVTEQLAIGYGVTPLASGIDLSLRPRSVTCLLGPNGVGKTTLFKTLLGLVPALSGSVRIATSDLSQMSRAAIARHVAYVPQSYVGDFGYTALDLVVMGRTAHLGPFSSPTQRDLARALAALEALGVAALAERDARRISGGQRQLVLIARALAQEAGIVVMDEPTASLDLANRNLVLERIRALKDEGLAVLVSTHEPEQAFALADQVAVLARGGGFSVGPVHDVLTPERLSATYDLPLTVETTPSGRHVVSPLPRSF